MPSEPNVLRGGPKKIDTTVAEKTAISPTRSENCPEWYQQVVKAADLAEALPVRGCMVIKPWGYAIWEGMQADLDRRRPCQPFQNATGRQRTRMGTQTHRPSALGAPPTRYPKHPVQQRRPGLVVRVPAAPAYRQRRDVFGWNTRGWRRDHLRTPRAPPGQDAVVQHLVRTRPRNQRREPLHQLHRRERQRSRAVRTGASA